MTTWGSVDDFKYYLPRLLELASTGELELDNFIILGKLGYADWKNWDKIEQETITHFLKSWWKYEINNGQYLESKTLLELLKYIDDFQWMLNCWNLEIDTVGFRKFIDLVEYDYWSLSQENQTFKKLSKAQLSLFIEWIESKSSLLEKAFFEFEKTDVEFSTRISNSLYMIECKLSDSRRDPGVNRHPVRKLPSAFATRLLFVRGLKRASWSITR